MNFGVVFCAMGVALWLMQVVYLITECATEKKKLPSSIEYMEWTASERVWRNARVVKIGAAFFFLFGVQGWATTSGHQSVTLDLWQLIYATTRLLLPLFLYINISMRFLIYRCSENYVRSKGSAELRNSIREVGISPKGDDVPSQVVRKTNALVVLTFGLLVFSLLTLSW